MAFPNLIGVWLLSSRVKRELDAYLEKLGAGAFQRYG
jgi:Na+/alanine symporter